MQEERGDRETALTIARAVASRLVRCLPKPETRARKEHLKRFYGRLHESQGQNLAVNVLRVPCSLDSDMRARQEEWGDGATALAIASYARNPNPRTPVPAAAHQGNNSKGSQDFCLKVKAKNWP